MPIYEFFCPDNNKLYSFLANRVSDYDKIPRCPDNSAYRLERRVSPFAITQNRDDDHEDEALDHLNESQLEAAMSLLERELGGIDDENPDPKQMKRLMERFTEITGQKMPEAFQEMMAQLEKGEDPEALEEAFADQLDDADLVGQLKHLKQRKRGPIKDPNLYWLADFL